MRLLLCLSLFLFACAHPMRVRYCRIERIVMRDARTFTFVVKDGRWWRSIQVRADDVTILTDVPPSGPAWAEHIDAPHDLAGAGDRLILHVRALTDIE